MSSPTSTPSHLDRLPTELLEKIVMMVAAQDKRFRKNGIARSTPLPTSRKVRYQGESDDEYEEVRADPGTVSWWYGGGVNALSLQNKRLRELCLPLLCPVLKPSQCTKPIFCFGQIPQALLDGIKRLDLRDTSEPDFMAAAERLPQLANLAELDVPAMLPFSPGYERLCGSTAVLRAARQLAKEAFRTNSPRITALAVHGYGSFAPSIADWVSIFAQPQSLLRLECIDCGTALYYWNTAFHGVAGHEEWRNSISRSHGAR
ncbi:proteophosphoglycan ppg4 [Rhodotorula toruloides]|uniref:Proteophosphoglycan ppg4 n=1 Tax=Rhodotorula toruloides TaxID=5286 RepID=A0A511KDD1_RHOTO|nr:proteophosphoglycan ppg4 [Rhodotorula toruloides]